MSEHGKNEVQSRKEIRQKQIQRDQEIKELHGEVQEHRVRTAHHQLVKARETTLRVETLSTLPMTGTDVARVETNLRQRHIDLSQMKTFITPVLTAVIQPTPGSLIFAGSSSGSGKSTGAANLTYSNYLSGHKTIVYSPEEPEAEVLMRVACVAAGLNYNKRTSFGPTEQFQIKHYVQKIAPFVRVVDGVAMTAIESAKRYFDKLLQEANGVWDMLIIDYYTKICHSEADPSKGPNDVQAELCRILDDFKNNFKAPIVVFGQLHPLSRDKKNFEDRIKGRRMIFEVATVVIEIIKDEEFQTTNWIIHKHRFASGGPRRVVTDFKRGRHVDREGDGDNGGSKV